MGRAHNRHQTGLGPAHHAMGIYRVEEARQIAPSAEGRAPDGMTRARGPSPRRRIGDHAHTGRDER